MISENTKTPQTQQQHLLSDFVHYIDVTTRNLGRIEQYEGVFKLPK